MLMHFWQWPALCDVRLTLFQTGNAEASKELDGHLNINGLCFLINFRLNAFMIMSRAHAGDGP